MKSNGFSLVELSIVLVILGLLTGGILTGQSLIRASELRAVTTEFKNYSAAVNTFRDKYFAIPGDMRNAESFWGTMSGGTCPNATGGSGTQTCNGTGDGTLGQSAAASQTSEHFMFWKQLANAGLIEGSYSGISGSGSTNDTLPAQNAPNSKLTNATWHVMSLGVFAGNAENFANSFNNHFVFGVDRTGSDPMNAALSPEEAWNIDTKIDDGKPGYGNVIANHWNNGCSSADDGSPAATDLNASYRLSDSSKQCSLRLEGGF